MREASPISEFTLELPNELTALIDQAMTEVNAAVGKPLFKRPKTKDEYVALVKNLLALGLSSTGIVFFGISLSDPSLPKNESKYLFAMASFLANAAQYYLSIQDTFEQYSKRAQLGWDAIRQGRQGLERLLDVDQLPSSQKYLIGFKNASLFAFTEGFKWTLLTYVSKVAPSLAKQVPWLDNDWFITLLHLAVMLMLQPGINDRITDVINGAPALSTTKIVKSEQLRFSQAVHALLRKNAESIINSGFGNDSIGYQLIQKINDNEKASALQLTFNPYPKKQIFLKENKSLQLASTLSLWFIYIMSMTGSYQSTWETSDDVIAGAGSILGDSSFGLYMAIMFGKLLVETNYRQFRNLKTLAKFAVTLLVSIAVAALTVGSTMAENEEAGMPFWVVLFGIAGTIFDNAAFIAEFLSERFKANALNSGDNIAKIDNYFETFIEELSKLPPAKQIEFLAKLNLVSPTILNQNNFQKLLWQELPWSQGLSVTNIIQVLNNKDDQVTLKSFGNRFGKRRRQVEIVGSSMSMVVAGISFVSLFSAPSFWLTNIPLTLAMPIGMGITHMLSPKKETNEQQPLLNSGLFNQRATAKKSQWSDTLFLLLTLTLPLVIKFGGKAALEWVFTMIFLQLPEDAERYAEIGANSLATVSAGMLSQTNSIRLR